MSSRLRLEPYVAQAARWPRAGKHVMAQFAKAPQCARCDFDRACLGVRRDYLAQHGDAELVPFRIARATDSDSGAGSDSDSGSGMESASP